MKIERLETHDRYLELMKQQSLSLSQGAEDCLKRNDLSLRLQQSSPYIYIWAHPRTTEDGSAKRMLWQPRLKKPKAQTNSYLFRAKSNSDEIEVVWMIPPREMWPQYKKGYITESEVVNWSINQFQNNREELEKDNPEDLNDERIKSIYLAIAADIDEHKRIKSLHSDNVDIGKYIPIE